MAKRQTRKVRKLDKVTARHRKPRGVLDIMHEQYVADKALPDPTPSVPSALEYTPAEKRDILTALKSAAVALAEVWDVLRGIETDHDNVEIEIDNELVGTLAGECHQPPSPRDINDEYVWEEFEAHARVIRS